MTAPADDGTDNAAPADRFWETKSLGEMTRAEWESLCDGCGKCCLYKLEDIDTGDIVFTNVVCHLQDGQTCRCAAWSVPSSAGAVMARYPSAV